MTPQTIFKICTEVLGGDEADGWKARTGRLLGVKPDTIDAFCKGTSRIPPGVWRDLGRLLKRRSNVAWPKLVAEVEAQEKAAPKPPAKAKTQPRSGFHGTPILTWTCARCGWANDNNNGPCRKCGALE